MRAPVPCVLRRPMARVEELVSSVQSVGSAFQGLNKPVRDVGTLWKACKLACVREFMNCSVHYVNVNL